MLGQLRETLHRGLRRLVVGATFVSALLAPVAELAAQKNIYVERDLKEVTVKPRRQRYHRKGNPAVELMRKVIEAKAGHDLDRNDFYSYYRYQRITTGLNNITREMADSMRILNSTTLKNQVEYCTQTGKYILPMHFMEEVTQRIYRRSPHAERDFVLGTNSEGITDFLPIGDNINTVIGTMFTDINIYDDVIELLERRFASPLSRTSAIRFYHYFIDDTVEVDNRSCIQVSFVPQNSQDFGFSGRLWILNDSTYRVHKCSVYFPMKTAVNYITNLVVEQRFTDLPNGQRVLLTDDLFAELGILKGQRMAFVHRATNYTGLTLDSIAPGRFTASDTRREGTSQVDDTAFWARHRIDTLTHAERNLGNMVNAFNRLRGSGLLLYATRSIVNNLFETSSRLNESRVDIGPIMSIFSSNFIDGFRLRLGAQTTARLHPHLFLRGYAAYGTRSRNWYGMAEVEYSFLRKQLTPYEFPRHSITAQIQKDVFSPADMMWQHGRDKDNVWTSFKTQTVDHMMFQRNALLRYDVETNAHMGFKLQLKQSKTTPCGSLFYRRLDGTDVPHLNTSELLLSWRWAPGEHVLATKQGRRVVDHNHPVFTLAHTFGIKGLFGADYRYNVTELTAFHRQWLNSYGRIDFNLRGAVQWNQVPFPLLLMPVANNSYIITRDMFCMINNMEFINDRYLSFQAEWNLNGKLLNRIPLINRLKWREVIGFKALYGHLSAKNDPSRVSSSRQSALFEFPSRDGLSIVHPMTHVPYMEANIGLHNIFKFIRIDYVYRINYHHFPGVKKHGVRFCLQFDF